MSSSAEAGGSSRRKQSAPRRVVRFDDCDGVDHSNVAECESSAAPLGFPASSFDEDGDAPPQLGHAVIGENELEEYQDESSSDDGWHVSSLIEGREPRRKKLKTSSGKKPTKAEKKREEMIKQGIDISHATSDISQ
jgi:hypothetical protein